VKILYTNFHHRNGGGHVTYILNLAKALAQEHDVTVATPDTSRLFRYCSQLPGVRVIDARYTSRIFRLIPEVWRLRKLLKKERYDIVHVNASADHRHVMLACLGLARRPRVVWTKHNDHPVVSMGHRLRARLATDQVIAVSAFVAGLLQNSPYRVVPINVVRHGIDTDYFAPVGAARKLAAREHLLGTGTESLIVWGSTGGTDYDKGWLDLAAAVALLEPAERQRIRVVVAGDPPDANKRGIVQKLGVEHQLVFPGLLDDVRDTLAACDAGFVLSYREALSFAARESMALGLPTLVSAAGGLPENVDNGSDGWIVPVRDPEAIAEVLRDVLRNPARLAAMGVAARSRSLAEFNLDQFVQQTLSVYGKAMG
jgi:glycosyltransferase involved in cell wall biosynthesis